MGPAAAAAGSAPDPAAAPSPASRRVSDAGYRCAICGAQVPAPGGGAPDAGASAEAGAGKAALAHRYRPFCSARCQRIDLGNWLDERYVVPGAPAAAGEPEDPEADPV